MLFLVTGKRDYEFSFISRSQGQKYHALWPATIDSLTTYLKKAWWAPNPDILIYTMTTCAFAKMLQRNTQVWVSTVTICSPEMDSSTSPAWGTHQVLTWSFSQICRRNEVVCKTKSCAGHWILGRTGFYCGNFSGCRIQNHIQNQKSISLHRAVRLLSSLSCCYPALFFPNSLLITGMGCPQFAPEKLSLIMS